jgi:hypothetical protein
MTENLVFGIYHDAQNDQYRTHADIDPRENAMLYLLLAEAQQDILHRMKPLYKVK